MGIRLENIDYVYAVGTAEVKKALDDINLKINKMSKGMQEKLQLILVMSREAELYILDEPSIGLHQRDNDKLLKTLLKLRDLGNTLIVVEHD